MKHLIRGAAAALAALLVAAAPQAARAESAASFPSKPIRIVVPYAPGGSNDVFARAMAKRLTEVFKQSVVVENRAGGGGIVGENYVAHAPADGYTLVYVSSSFATSAAAEAHLPFDPIKDFTPVAMTGEGPMVIVVNNKLPARTVPEFIALAKKEPGKLNYATSGPGSINQFATELFAQQTGIKLTHIPYKGMGPAMNDLIGGQVDVIFGSIPSVMQQARAGMVRPLAVTTPGKSALAPELEPVSASVAGFEVISWSGLLAPGGTPTEIVDKLNTTINRILQDDEMKKFLHNEGVIEASLTARQFAQTIATDIGRWRKLAASAGIRTE
jgi:tripartite-type tricarboxylate transporter receptor subunit TctC